MAASRLSDGQKQELVERYRQGETAQALAAAYGCSPHTVSRVVKGALDPEELAALKKQPRSRAAAPAAAVAAAAGMAAEAEGDVAETVPQAPEVPEPPLVQRDETVSTALPSDTADADPPTSAQAEHEEPAHLAIDDADDFGDDGLDDGLDDGDEAEFAVVPTAAFAAGEPRVAASARPLQSGALPASVYLLVDKTVELDIRPLREFAELGTLPEDEQDRQALMLYANPRQAKRQCGRSQRVIKVPDSGVLERTSRYLVAQGITRLVLEGGDLFAIPGA